MRTRLTGLFAFVIVASSLVFVRGQQAPPQPGEAVPGEVLVEFRPGAPANQRAAIRAAHAAIVLQTFDRLDIELLRIGPGRDVAATVTALRATPAVVTAQPNYLRQVSAPPPPNDTFWLNDFLWGMQKIQAQQVWTTYPTGSPAVIVADIDTGVNYLHEDLAANMWRNPLEIPANGIDDDNNGYTDDVYGIDTVNGDADPMDDNGHGTHTSGTIAGVGNNGTGVVGVTWNSRILACKFLNANGNGSDAGAIACLNYVIALKQRGENIRVTNNSWGAIRGFGFPTALQNAFQAAGNVGILHVVAAGNNAFNIDQTPFDPAAFTLSSIITVASSDSADNRSSFSNWGPVSVDLAAPGSEIVSTYGNSYAFLSGTSMATPHVAGAAALLLAIDSSLNVDQLRALLLNNVDVLPGWSGLVATGGRLNLLRTAQAANSPPSVSITSPADGAIFTAPATVTVAADAADADGTVTQVEFFVNGGSVGVDASSPYGMTLNNLPSGNYTLTAVATDNRATTATSVPVAITVGNGEQRINVALAANGGGATASSTHSPGYAPSGAINGDRRGLNWGNGGGWNDATNQVFPDSLEVQFSAAQTIDEINVFGQQDNYLNPVDPTASMTFSEFGLSSFDVQYWTGTAWTTVPGGNVVNNTLVWRQVQFAPITTTKIRIIVTTAPTDRWGNSWSRIVELEAWTAAGAPADRQPLAALTSPIDGAISMEAAAASLRAGADNAAGIVAQLGFVDGPWAGRVLRANGEALSTFCTVCAPRRAGDARRGRLE